MSRQLKWRCLAAGSYAHSVSVSAILICVPIAVCIAAEPRATQEPSSPDTGRSTANQPSNDNAKSPQRDKTANRQDDREAAFAKMLSGATLEGSFTSTGEGSDPTKLSREKYTLGTVKKLAGNFWLIPARIQYGEHDLTLPITVPIEWAGDTPLIVVDNIPLPVFGTVSARVMFFADHYAGYWKHGDHGGHLFGVIRRDEQATAQPTAPPNQSRSVDEAPAGEKPND